jgi:hypothetical protein
MRRASSRTWKVLLVAVGIGAFGGGVRGDSGKSDHHKYVDDRMSAMGAAAAKAREVVDAGAFDPPDFDVTHQDDAACFNDPRCPAGFREDGPVRAQSELSIAVDATGQHVVVGYNDFRGASLNPLSISGFMFSDDGGQTFTDGGQLPTPGTDLIGTTRFPQVFGDPEIEYLGDCTFIYSSIMVKKFSATTTAQTMSVHRSLDCGHTWQGPFEVPAATNPNGLLTTAGVPRDAADKEFMSIDPETKRVILTWSNFTPVSVSGVEISSTYSDNILATPPTWSTRQVIAATTADGQGSDPAFAAGSSNAYVVWRRFPFPGVFFGFGNTIGFAKSTNNGQTWSTPIDLSPEFLTIDQVLGNDRVNTSPSIAVDNTDGPNRGNIYVVYSNNNSQDGADIVFQRSRDQGATFSEPLLLNSRPGEDRTQWFPWVTVDKTTGRVYVMYYDQGIATSGDRTEKIVTFSDEGGVHWVAPQPLSRRQFNAGWGNDTSQPNLGDYNQGVALNGDLYAAFAETAPPPLGFVDGQPDTSLTTPDVAFRRYRPSDALSDGASVKPVTLDLQAITFTDSGGNGFLDPGETAQFQFTLRNYVTNPLNARKVTGIQAALSTSTPGVVVTKALANYDNIAPGASAVNKRDFVVTLLPSFVAGTHIEFVLEIKSADRGSAALRHRQFTGTPVATTLMTQNFDGVVPGTLPAGWTVAHGGGAVTVPWTTSNTFCGPSNGAFHVNDTGIRFERLFSPAVVVPPDAQYVVVEFDVCYDTEDDPNFNILAYDGFLLRITDLTVGRTLRSVLAEAFADELTTGTLQHYPRHLPRFQNAGYLEDMSAWAGYSNGRQHVRMRLPGMAGSTMQLRFEYTQDSVASCADVRPGHSCGVLVDNVSVTSVKAN